MCISVEDERIRFLLLIIRQKRQVHYPANNKAEHWKPARDHIIHAQIAASPV